MKIFHVLLIVVLLVVAGATFYQSKEENLGIAVPTTIAVYSDSLQASISSSASSFTLVRGTDKRGTALAGQRLSMVIDEGTSSEEFMIATCTSTACTINSRGLDPINPTTEVTALKFAHRRGASVKITDYPQLAILSRIINGDERFPNHVGLQQAFVSATASTTDFATKAYVDSVGAGGFTAANVINNSGLYVAGTAPETVGVYISATSSALRFGGISDDQLMLKLNNDLTITADGNLRIATTTAFIWTGIHTFNSSLTANATNTAYILINDGLVQTFSAGEAITANRAVYVSPTTSEVFLASNVTGVPTSTLAFIGFALNTVAENATVHVQTSGLYTRLTGLTPGASYYINASGNISTATSTGTYVGRVGRALTSTVLDLNARYGATQFILSRSDTSESIEVPEDALVAIVSTTCGSGSDAAQNTVDLTLTKYGKMSATLHDIDENAGGGAIENYSCTVKWDTSTNSITISGAAGTMDATAYFYR